MAAEGPISGSSPAGNCMRHPVVVAMLALWILNDHVLKDLFGNAWTGKLSDVAGLVVFPLIPLAVYQVGCAWRKALPRYEAQVFYGGLLATLVLFVSINLSVACSDLCCSALAVAQWPLRALVSAAMGEGLIGMVPVVATPDPTDLLTLPALAIPFALGRKFRWAVSHLEDEHS